MVEWLAGHGARVGVSEAKPETDFPNGGGTGTKLDRVEFGGHTEAFLCSSDLIVVSPGVPLSTPAVSAATRRGLPVVGEMEVVLDSCPARVVAVTGTNGKTTTTALIGHLLEAGGAETAVAGNIGYPVSRAVDGLTDRHTLVLEVSSFQLDIAPSFHPYVAVLLNITADHLDRYPSFEAYVESKSRVFANQSPSDLAVMNRLDERCAGLARELRSRVRWFDASGDRVEGAGVADGWIVLVEGTRRSRVLPVGELRLRGGHNVENALAAAVAASSLGVTVGAIAEGLRTFEAVEHRLEPSGSVGEVHFINDSKATNVDAQEKALRSFPEPVVLIAGGQDKGGDFTRLAPLLEGSVKAAVLIGVAAEKIAAAWRGAIPIHRAGSLEEAVRRGFELASPRGVVLLSPGCASFDMFADFEDRGRRFREAVRELGATGSAGGSK